MEINLLIFDGSPESLHEDVVIDPAPSIHADLNMCILQAVDEVRRGKLCPLVHVENLGLGTLKGFFQGLYAECRVQADRQLPGQNIAAEPIHDGHKVNKSMIHPNVR